MKNTLFTLALLVLLGSCKTDPKTEMKTESVQTEKEADWIYLFDGTSTEGWRAYNGETLPPGWVIKNKELTFDTELGLEQDYEGGKDIIVSVYDITGKQVIAKSYTNNPSRIDLYEVEKLRSGSYFVKISTKDTTKILRIVGGSR